MSVLSHLQSRSSAALLSAVEKSSILRSISTLQSRLNAYFGSDLDSHFVFGSYTRDTILPRMMDSDSDIDYMVVFKEGGFRPQTYLDKLRRFVSSSYYSSEIYQSNPTIVLNLNHIKFELVPALTEWWSGFKIPGGISDWQSTNPNDFNATLSSKNSANGYNIKPTIRLAKIWNAANSYPYNSYDFEKWIVEQSFYMCSNQRDYLFAVFDKMSVPYHSQWRKERIERAKRIIAEVRRLEGLGLPVSAEIELKKLIPG